jgi:hypothetical protein
MPSLLNCYKTYLNVRKAPKIPAIVQNPKRFKEKKVNYDEYFIIKWH